MGKVGTNAASRTNSVVFCGLIVAFMVVSAWVTIPLGPVPVTLQVFTMVFALLFMSPRQYFVSLSVYLAIGAVGLPVFSGMRGGIGVLAGPTGGFLWGWLVAAAIAYLVLGFFRKGNAKSELGKQARDAQSKSHAVAKNSIAAIVFLVVMYVCGWIQLILVAGYDPLAAFLTGVAPFIVMDSIKIVAAVFLVEALKRALPQVFTQTI